MDRVSERRLAAIMFTDIVDYTALMAESEEKGLRAKDRHRALVRPLVERYHGEWIESPGDQSLSTPWPSLRTRGGLKSLGRESRLEARGRRTCEEFSHPFGPR